MAGKSKLFDDGVLRECSGCGIRKPRTEFFLTQSGRGGHKILRRRCKQCVMNRNRQRLQEKRVGGFVKDLKEISDNYPCKHTTLYFENSTSDQVMRCHRCGRRWAKADKVGDDMVISHAPTNSGFGTDVNFRTKVSRKVYLKLDFKKRHKSAEAANHDECTAL